MWDQKDGPSVAERMTEEGVVMREGDNKRVPGWDLLRWYLSNYEVPEGLDTGEEPTIVAKEPMFYVTENCEAFIRTLPILERSEKDWEDVGDDQEDHVADEPLHPDTLVHTFEGFIPIKDIPKKGFVYTINGKLTEYHSCRKTRSNASLVEIEIEDGTKIKCCPTHEFLTNQGFIAANNLTGLSIHCNVSPKKEEKICYHVRTGLKKNAPQNLVQKYVVAVRSLKERSDVYCMSVPETEVFEIEGGLLTHNCRYVVMSRQQSGSTLEEMESPKETECERDWAEIEDPEAAINGETDDFFLPL